MREILFRGKRVDNGEWVYGAYFEMAHTDNRHSHHFIIPIGCDLSKNRTISEIQVEVIPETIGQYIGLIDGDENKIFTGDIVTALSHLTGKTDTYIIKFSNDSFLFGFAYADMRHGYVFSFDELLEIELGDEIDFRVIGNIFDNPELLESEDK